MTRHTNDDIAISVKDLTKMFKIPLESHSGLKQKLINQLKGRKGYREFKPLNDISFDIKKGEFFGIVGRNGSGKSTLLKTIAGIYAPERGAVKVNGTLVPFIELGVGFNAELSGRENVYLNGALLGFSHDEMDEMYDEIVDFAELHDFMEERLKNYSSGMQVRLAFSIAIRAKGDILLLDEVLAVGDEAFQRKCYEYFGKLKRDNKTVVLVTHSMSNVEQFCDRALLLEKGHIKKTGTNIEIAQAYRELFDEDYKKQLEKHAAKKAETNHHGLKKVEAYVSQDGKKTTAPKKDRQISINVEFHSDHSYKEAVVGMNVVDSQNNIVYGTSTKRDMLFTIQPGKNKTVFTMPNIFSNGTFSINLAIGHQYSSGLPLLFKDIELARFSVSGRGSFERGMVAIPGVTITVGEKNESKK